MGKIAFWGSIASIIGLSLAFYTVMTESEEKQQTQQISPSQITHESQSPNVSTNQGDINITYGNGTIDSKQKNKPPPKVLFYYAKADVYHCWALPLITVFDDNTFTFDIWVEPGEETSESDVSRRIGSWEEVFGRYVFTFSDKELAMVGTFQNVSVLDGEQGEFSIRTNTQRLSMWGCALQKTITLTNQLKAKYKDLP